jgi:uncharacterized protein with HEPN domain
MPRDALAYLSDIVDARDAIFVALTGVDLEAYQRSRLVRSSVEGEFIIIGEAISALSRVAPDAFASITHARRIVDFRNSLRTRMLRSMTRWCGRSPIATRVCCATNARH